MHKAPAPQQALFTGLSRFLCRQAGSLRGCGLLALLLQARLRHAALLLHLRANLGLCCSAMQTGKR